MKLNTIVNKKLHEDISFLELNNNQTKNNIGDTLAKLCNLYLHIQL